MNREDLFYFACCAGLIFVIIAIGIVLWIFASYMEAKSFNRVTGKSVTTYEAMWIELRVMEETKGE